MMAKAQLKKETVARKLPNGLPPAIMWRGVRNSGENKGGTLAVPKVVGETGFP